MLVNHLNVLVELENHGFTADEIARTKANLKVFHNPLDKDITLTVQPHTENLAKMIEDSTGLSVKPFKPVGGGGKLGKWSSYTLKKSGNMESVLKAVKIFLDNNTL